MRICFQKHFFILFSILVADFLSLTIAQITTCIDGGGNYTNNSTYQSNLNALVSHMSSQIDDYGFGNFSFGQDPDTTHSLTLCRGDVEINDCRSCVREVMINVTRICGNHKEAVGWVENCTVRYSSKSLYDKVSYDAYWCGYLLKNATNQDKFNTDLRTLLGGLIDKAASGGPHKKYATDNVTAFDLETIRGLMQCTPDLSEKECSDCLVKLMGSISGCSPGKLGMKMFCASCTFKYEAYSFYGDPTGPKDTAPSPMPQTLTSPPTTPRGGTNTTGKSKSKIQMITIIVAASIASIILFTACICLYLRKRKLRKTVQKTENSICQDLIEKGENINKANSLSEDDVDESHTIYVLNTILSGTARLNVLLPTATILAFTIFAPLLTNDGKCETINRWLMGIFMAISSASCLFFSVTDSFKSPTGRLYYGLATFKGIWTFNSGKKKPMVPSDYRLKWTDFFHSALSLIAFLTFAALHIDVVDCYYPALSRKVSNTVPLVVGFVISVLFVMFPSKRRGIGYPFLLKRDALYCRN